MNLGFLSMTHMFGHAYILIVDLLITKHQL